MSRRILSSPALRVLAVAVLGGVLAACGSSCASHPHTGATPSPASSSAPGAGAPARVTAAGWEAPAVKPLEGVRPASPEETRIILGAVGDVLLHSEVQASAAAREDGYPGLFSAIANELQAPDLLFANLETPVAPAATMAGSGNMSFNAPLAALTALRDVGVDVVSVANNHIFDRGRRGLDATLENLEAEQLPYVGAGLAPHEAGPRILEVRGVRVGWLAWTQVLNREFPGCAGKPPCAQVAVLREWAPVLARVREVAPTVDALVVSLHWGTEYALEPDEGQRTFAQLLVQAGADVVLGHHPHVLQPIERFARGDGSVGVVAYSLGNLISNQSRTYRVGREPKANGATRDGVLLRVELAQAPGAQDGARPRARILGLDALPLWTENRRGTKDEPSRIEVVATARALAEVTGSPTDAAAPESRRAQRLYRERLAFVAKVLGEPLIREPGDEVSTLRAGAATP